MLVLQPALNLLAEEPIFGHQIGVAQAEFLIDGIVIDVSSCCQSMRLPLQSTLVNKVDEGAFPISPR